MADPLPTWHGKPLYVCPHCGTSRFTPAALERHLTARHDIAPVPQATALPVAAEAPLPTPEDP